MLEPSWPHMQLVYEILLRFVLSKEVDSRTAKDYFSKRFMIKLLNLFDSKDPRERDYLKVGYTSSGVGLLLVLLLVLLQTASSEGADGLSCALCEAGVRSAVC